MTSSATPGPTTTSPSADTAWLPEGFTAPGEVVVPFGHRLRPVRASDAELALVAVLGSERRLRARYAATWGWPSAMPSLEQQQAELARDEHRMRTGRAFRYALLDTDETAWLGCVHLCPPRDPVVDAEISWWVVDECVGTPLATALDALVPRWVAQSWPWRSPRFLPAP